MLVGLMMLMLRCPEQCKFGYGVLKLGLLNSAKLGYSQAPHHDVPYDELDLLQMAMLLCSSKLYTSIICPLDQRISVSDCSGVTVLI